MADVTAAMVKALREATGAGMMDCKKALVETGGDSEQAAKLLKERGLAAVAKRAERATSEGRIFVRQVGSKIAAVQLLCETDFVAKNADFGACGEKILDEIFANGYTDVTDDLKAVLLDFASRTRENMSIGKIDIINVAEGSCAGVYVHSDFKTGAVVVIKGSTDVSANEKVKEFAHDCCMHLVAYTPVYLTSADVPESYIAEQKEIFLKQMAMDPNLEDKPQNIKDGILKGKIKKHLAEVCFVDQAFVKDDKKSVKAKLDEVAKSTGGTLEFESINLLILGK